MKVERDFRRNDSGLKQHTEINFSAINEYMYEYLYRLFLTVQSFCDFITNYINSATAMLNKWPISQHSSSGIRNGERKDVLWERVR